MRDGGPGGARLWKASVPGSVWSILRVRASLTAAPSEVLALLLDDARIGEYDELFDKISLVEAVEGGDCAFKRTAYKPVWPTAPRDFSLLSMWGTLEDGSAYLCNRSVDHPGCPRVDGWVRGVVMLCGFLMVPTAVPAMQAALPSGSGNPENGNGGGGGGGCTLTMIVHTDLGGSLPASIINVLSTSAPVGAVQRLQRIFEK
ncbi:unnamed protein product, partial [Phaeothamnion confervicola]